LACAILSEVFSSMEGLYRVIASWTHFGIPLTYATKSLVCVRSDIMHYKCTIPDKSILIKIISIIVVWTITRPRTIWTFVIKINLFI